MGPHDPPRPPSPPRDRVPRQISRCTARGAARTSSRPFPPVRRHHCHRPVSKSHAESTALQSHWGLTPSDPAGLIATTFFDLHDRSQISGSFFCSGDDSERRQLSRRSQKSGPIRATVLGYGDQLPRTEPVATHHSRDPHARPTLCRCSLSRTPCARTTSTSQWRPSDRQCFYRGDPRPRHFTCRSCALPQQGRSHPVVVNTARQGHRDEPTSCNRLAECFRKFHIHP